MTRDEIKLTLAQIVEEIRGTPCGRLDDERNLREAFELDSLDLFTMAIEVQQKLGVAVEVKDVDENGTVGGFVAMLDAKIRKLPSGNRAA